MAHRPVILVLAGIPDDLFRRIAERYDAIDARVAGVLAVEATILGKVQGIACTGRARLGATEIAALPLLTVVSSYSAGLDQIDEAALRHRGIPLYSTSAALADSVADLAVIAMLSLMRRLFDADRFVRSGQWGQAQFPLAQSPQGRRVGILGFGHIGKAIAHRCRAFGLEIAYSARQQKPACADRFFADATSLAQWADVLVVACSATPATRGLVNEKVLAQLGADGMLVNVARGSIVDDVALVKALSEGTIAGAALDVFTDEPNVPLALLPLHNVILTPHIGSATRQTREAMARATLDALDNHFGRTGAAGAGAPT